MITEEQFWSEATERALRTNRTNRARFARRFALVSGTAQLGTGTDKKLLLVALLGRNSADAEREVGERWSTRTVSGIAVSDKVSPPFLYSGQEGVQYNRTTSLLFARVVALEDFLPDVPDDRGKVVSSMDMRIPWDNPAQSKIGIHNLTASYILYKEGYGWIDDQGWLSQ